jgi:hypothetical protein
MTRRPGVQARHSVANLAALTNVYDGPTQRTTGKCGDFAKLPLVKRAGPRTASLGPPRSRIAWFRPALAGRINLKASAPRPSPVVDAERARLGAVGRRHQEIGELGVGAIRSDELLGVVAPAPPARLTDDGERRPGISEPSRGMALVHHRSTSCPHSASSLQSTAVDPAPGVAPRRSTPGRLADLSLRLPECRPPTSWGPSSGNGKVTVRRQGLRIACRAPCPTLAFASAQIGSSPSLSTSPSETPRGLKGDVVEACKGQTG